MTTTSTQACLEKLNQTVFHALTQGIVLGYLIRTRGNLEAVNRLMVDECDHIMSALLNRFIGMSDEKLGEIVGTLTNAPRTRFKNDKDTGVLHGSFSCTAGAIVGSFIGSTFISRMTHIGLIQIMPKDFQTRLVAATAFVNPIGKALLLQFAIAAGFCILHDRLMQSTYCQIGQSELADDMTAPLADLGKPAA
jgi:hypothetical protein